MRYLSFFALVLVSACSNCQNSNTSVIAPPQELSRVQTIPKLDMDGLTPEQKSAFIEFTNDEVCPCGCPKTFAGCLQDQKECPAGKLLAQWMVERLKSGLPQEMLTSAVSKEIAGFSEKQVDIPSHGEYGQKGPSKAAVQIVEFADFQCGACRLATGSVNSLVKSNKDINLIYKHFPLQRHEMAEKAAWAAEAAGRQGKYWEMHRALFSTQNYLSDKLIEGHATALGLDALKFKTDMADPKIKAIIDAGKKEALKLKLEGTPSIFFNGRPYHLSFDKDALELRANMERVRDKSGC